MMKTHKTPLHEAWQNWKDGLEGDDINSVFNQIISMIWDTAILKIIREGQKNKFTINPEEPRINQSLYSFIYGNYLHTQSSYIRRLTDSSYGIRGTRGVYSLTAIIKDIQEYQYELTRERFLELKNMPYDYSEIIQKRREFFRNIPPGKAVFIPPEFNWIEIEETHQIYDRLSRTNKEIRNPDDRIKKLFFARINEKLEECKNITHYVDKFVAHSATPESRAVLNNDEFNISLNNIWSAHRTIYEIANFLSATLFSSEHMVLPIENPTFFDFWCEPFFEKEEVDKIINILDTYRKETEEWISSSNKNIWAIIEK